MVRVRVIQCRKGANASTSVTLILTAAAGPVYDVRGVRPDIRAVWTDNAKVLIETPKLDTMDVRFNITLFGYCQGLVIVLLSQGHQF
jgi:hypothetical protein